MDERLDLATNFLSFGFTPIPIDLATKRPPIKWKQYQTTRPTPTEVSQWFAPQSPYSLGVLTGAASQNLEVIDVDDEAVGNEFISLLQQELPHIYERLVIVKTKKGYHLYYFCQSTPHGNQKLARAADKSTRIETRGEGGLVVTVGSADRELIQGRMSRVPTLTADEVTSLHSIARSFDDYVADVPTTTWDASAPLPANAGERPGDLFNQQVSWEDILYPAGWTLAFKRSDGVLCLCRPGKSRTEGISATIGHGGHDIFYVFSSNAYPFEPFRGYTRFAAYALLQHNGDFKRAAKAAAQIVSAPPLQPHREAVATDTPPPPPPRRLPFGFTCSPLGVFKQSERGDTLVSGPCAVTSDARSEDGEWIVVLEFTDVSGAARVLPISRGQLHDNGSALCSWLDRNGLRIVP
jgi:hypothetical protein